jgi:hypothetical protein
MKRGGTSETCLGGREGVGERSWGSREEGKTKKEMWGERKQGEGGGKGERGRGRGVGGGGGRT